MATPRSPITAPYALAQFAAKVAEPAGERSAFAAHALKHQRSLRPHDRLINSYLDDAI
jgi:hypothetical protein